MTIGPDGNLYYHPKKVDKSFEEAKSICRSIGGSLVVVDTPEKQAFVTGLSTPGKSYWLALYDFSGANADFRWVRSDGSSQPISPGGYTNWIKRDADDEPNGPNERCVLSNPEGQWYDVSCDDNSPHKGEVICQKSTAGS